MPLKLVFIPKITLTNHLGVTLYAQNSNRPISIEITPTDRELFRKLGRTKKY